jgi:hypothetical protein
MSPTLPSTSIVNKSGISLACSSLVLYTLIALQACSSTKTTSQNPNWKHCPFYGLEFTYVKQSDTLSSSLKFNDSLIAGAESDLKSFKANGKVTNKLDLTIDRFRSRSSTSMVELDDNEYIEFITSKTKSICGLYGTIREGKIYKDPESRSEAVTMLNGFINDLANYSEKKKEELKVNANID